MPTVDDALQAHWTQFRFLAQRLATLQDPAWDADDLLQEGALGFLRAITDYDPARGATLWTYAEFRVCGAMREAKRELDPAPRSLRTKASTMAQAVQALSHQHGDPPEAAAVAEALSISLETYEQWRSAVACLERLSSLDYGYGPGMDNVSLYAFLADPTPGPAEQVAQADAQQQRAAALTSAMALLPAREYQVLRLRYWEEWSLKAIGAQLGLSESRISQLHGAALARLRRWMTTDENWPAVCALLTYRQTTRHAQTLARHDVLLTQGRRAYLRLWRAQRKEVSA